LVSFSRKFGGGGDLALSTGFRVRFDDNLVVSAYFFGGPSCGDVLRSSLYSAFLLNLIAHRSFMHASMTSRMSVCLCVFACLSVGRSVASVFCLLPCRYYTITLGGLLFFFLRISGCFFRARNRTGIRSADTLIGKTVCATK